MLYRHTTASMRGKPSQDGAGRPTQAFLIACDGSAFSTAHVMMTKTGVGMSAQVWLLQSVQAQQTAETAESAAGPLHVIACMASAAHGPSPAHVWLAQPCRPSGLLGWRRRRWQHAGLTILVVAVTIGRTAQHVSSLRTGSSSKPHRSRAATTGPTDSGAAFLPCLYVSVACSPLRAIGRRGHALMADAAGAARSQSARCCTQVGWVAAFWKGPARAA